jgi:hypothetical protein
MTENSTKPVATTIVHAGIATVEKYEAKSPTCEVTRPSPHQVDG